MGSSAHRCRRSVFGLAGEGRLPLSAAPSQFARLEEEPSLLRKSLRYADDQETERVRRNACPADSFDLSAHLAGGDGADPAGDEIVAGAQSAFGPAYSAPAGFVEAGETVEHAAVREVREEVGVEIANLRYFQSQPGLSRIR